MQKQKQQHVLLAHYDHCSYSTYLQFRYDMIENPIYAYNGVSDLNMWVLCLIYYATDCHAKGFIRQAPAFSLILCQ